MSLYKRCRCADAKCGHAWCYRFRLNGRNYRATTQTALKQQARNIESRERSRALEGRHGIRRQPDITFREFARTYLTDHAALHKRDGGVRDTEILARLNQVFGPLILHEITAHRIEQWKRERLAGKWRAHGQAGSAKPIKPATVNRELDVLKSVMSKAVEWGKLLDSPARRVKRLRVENRRTRVLSADEQQRLVAACRGKFRALVTLALLTGARRGELLKLEWDHVSDAEIVFLVTKNGRQRRLPLTPGILDVLRVLPRIHPWVFTNPRTGKPFQSVAKNLERALARAGISTGDVTFHTLRHTALSRMIAAGHSDHTVMAISGHSSTRMLERYVHPTQELKISALETGASLVQPSALSTQRAHDGSVAARERRDLQNYLRDFGGRHEARTRDLRVANAALSQLS